MLRLSYKKIASLDFILHCYTSTQNTCTRLVQIASRDVNKYALSTSQQ